MQSAPSEQDTAPALRLALAVGLAVAGLALGAVTGFLLQPVLGGAFAPPLTGLVGAMLGLALARGLVVADRAALRRRREHRDMPAAAKLALLVTLALVGSVLGGAIALVLAGFVLDPNDYAGAFSLYYGAIVGAFLGLTAAGLLIGRTTHPGRR